MATAAANSMNLGGRAAMEFNPRLASPCGLTVPSYMSQGCRKGAVSKLFKGSDKGLGGLAVEDTFRVPQGPGRSAVKEER